MQIFYITILTIFAAGFGTLTDFRDFYHHGTSAASFLAASAYTFTGGYYPLVW